MTTPTAPIEAALALLYRPGDVVELRVPKAGKYKTISGYFTDQHLLAVEAAKLSGNYPGIYVTLNPCEPALFARAANRAKPYAEATTADNQIVERRWILCDIDWERPAGISTTDTEHQAAIALAYKMRDDLYLDGWPSPIVADSGNGSHLLFRVELPTDDDGLIQATLKVLAGRFNHDKLRIDLTVFNPARIIKLYGTMGSKGDSIPDRPHRMSTILEVPHALLPVPTDLLSKPGPPDKTSTRRRKSTFDLGAWMATYAADAKGPKDYNGGHKWVFHVCPWRADDLDSAYVIQLASGAISAACQHDTCPGSRSTGNHWTELRAMRAGKRDIQVGRPEIIISGRALPDMTDDIIDALVEANNPESIFIRSGSLARVINDENGEPVIDALSESAACGHAARCAEYIRIAKDGEETISYPPLHVIRDLMALGSWPFPPLAGVVETPIVTPSGSIITMPGYNAESRLIYMANGTRPGTVPAAPTPADVKASAALLLEIIENFPFEDDASRANALAAIFTPIVRPLIVGPTPLVLLDKPQAGTGASLLAEIVALIATGRASTMLSAPTNDEEWEKRITAILCQGRTVITIDNVDGLLCSPPLASALTSTVWGGRILGQTQMVTLPQRATWIATGNNIRLGGDLPRRCYWVRMDAKSARPWQRGGFHHPNLLEWVHDERGHILTAMLTLVQAWLTAGRPSPTNLPIMGSYESWTRSIGGILAGAGITGFLGNIEAMYEQSDDETPAWEGFLDAWHTAFDDRPVTVKEMLAGATQSDALKDAIPDDVFDTRTKEVSAKSLGKALSKRNGVRYPNGYTVKKAGLSKRAVQWRVTSVHAVATPSWLDAIVDESERAEEALNESF